MWQRSQARHGENDRAQAWRRVRRDELEGEAGPGKARGRLAWSPREPLSRYGRSSADRRGWRARAGGNFNLQVSGRDRATRGEKRNKGGLLRVLLQFLSYSRSSRDWVFLLVCFRQSHRAAGPAAAERRERP